MTKSLQNFPIRPSICSGFVSQTVCTRLNLRRLSFSSRRCTDLEQSSAAYHICCITSCLMLSLEDIRLRILLPVITVVMGPKARTWLSKFFSRIMATHSIPKIWRKAKVIAIEKPGKDPSLPANYRPLSLLSVCYNLLERLALQRVSPTVEGLLGRV